LREAPVISHLQETSHLANQALFFKSDKCFRYPRAAEPQNIEVVVRKRKSVAVECIARQTEPARQPLFEIVSNTAQSRLSAMCGECLNVSRQMFANLRSLVHHASQIVSVDFQRASGKKHDGLMGWDMASEQK